MKNLTKQELTSFIGILLKKNPLIDIDVSDDSFILKYFNGETSTIKIQNETIIQNKTHQLENESNDELEEKFEKLSNFVFENINHNNIQQENISRTDVENMIIKYCENINPTIINQPVNINFHKIASIVKEQLKLINFDVAPIVEEKQLYLEDSISTSEFVLFKNEISNFVTKLKSEIESEISSIDLDVKNNKVDYTKVDSIITKKIDDLSKNLINHTPDFPKHVVGIENVHGKISVLYSDDSATDFTDLLTPIVQKIAQPLINSRVSRNNVGAGGYGGGSPGLSAYDIAVKNGFVGTEQDWLDSLSGSYVPPQDGTIIYDANNNITDIVVGLNTTTINRDSNNLIVSITKSNYIKEFIRDLNGNITGWNIINI